MALTDDILQDIIEILLVIAAIALLVKDIVKLVPIRLCVPGQNDCINNE